MEGREMDLKKIEALIRLLGDEDPKIHAVAREHLLRDVDLCLPMLEEQSRLSSDGCVRERSLDLLNDITREQLFTRWRDLASSLEGPDLEEGVFLIAQVESPGLDVSIYESTLDELGGVLERRTAGSHDPATVFPRLFHLLFREVGLRGNRENYYDPENSYLNSVLERKLGIPISLSVVCMLVSRRLGLKLEGIGLPRHFIVGYRLGGGKGRDSGKMRYNDPFNAGQEWSLEDCLQHLRAQGYPVDDRFLEPCDSTSILIRMLGNLLHIYKGLGDESATARVETLLIALESRQDQKR